MSAAVADSSQRKARAIPAREVKRVAVVGAGVMGGGIAYTSAVHGRPVIMKDITQEALDQGQAEARELLAKQVKSGRMQLEQMQGVLGSIRSALDYEGFGAVDVVIEAVTESAAVKKSVLVAVEEVVADDVIIASNTSSLSIAEMAGVLARPENFVGMHFFNPVPVMPLVEVIRGPRTSDLAVATITGYARAIGKTPVVVKDCPGFLVNRILVAYLMGQLRAIHDGASYLEIDRVMESFGWPMGPAHLQDVIGMDTLLHVLEAISRGYAQRMTIDCPHAVHLMNRQQRLGQKNGKGFYRYETEPNGRRRKRVDPETAALLREVQNAEPRGFLKLELQERLMLPMIIEAIRCLEEGIAASPGELDMALMLGTGFPRHAGGPLKYADWLGMEHVVARCDTYSSLGGLYEATDGMRHRAATGARFY